MSKKQISVFWIPLIFGIAFLVLSIVLPIVIANLPKSVALGGAVVAFLLIALAFALSDREVFSTGASGGSASVQGEESVALGGDAGDAGVGPGGQGGDAFVLGNKSYASGGKGGKG